MGASVSISEAQIAGLQNTGNAVCATFEKEYLAAFRRSIWNLFKENASSPDRVRLKVTQLSKGAKLPNRLGCKVLQVEDAGEDRDGNTRRMYLLEIVYGEARSKKLRRADGEMRALSSQFGSRGAPAVRGGKKDDGDRQRQAVESLLEFLAKDPSMLNEAAVQDFFAFDRSPLFSRCARAAVAKALQERQRIIHGQPLPNALSGRTDPADPANLDTEPRMLMSIVSDTLIRTAVPAIEKKTGKSLKPKQVRDIKRQMTAAASPQVDGTWGRVSAQVKGVQGQLMGGGAASIAMMAEAEAKGRQVLQESVERMLRPSLQTLEGAMIPEVLQEMADAIVRPFHPAAKHPPPPSSGPGPAMARPRPLPARLADIISVATSPMGQGVASCAGPLVSEIVAECRTLLGQSERAMDELMPTAERIDSALGPEAMTNSAKNLRKVAAALGSYLGGGLQPLATALEGVLRAIDSAVAHALAGSAPNSVPNPTLLTRAGELLRKEAAGAIEESEGRLARWTESAADVMQESLHAMELDEQVVSAVIRRVPALRAVMTTALATLADHAARSLPARVGAADPHPGAGVLGFGGRDEDRVSVTGSVRSEGGGRGGGYAHTPDERRRANAVLSELLSGAAMAAHAVAKQRVASWVIDVSGAVYAAVLLPEFDDKVVPIMERDGMLAPADAAVPNAVRPAVDGAVLAREFICDRVGLSACGTLKRVAALVSDRFVAGQAERAGYANGTAPPRLQPPLRKPAPFATGLPEREERPVLYDLDAPAPEPEPKPKGFMERLSESLACCSTKTPPAGHRPAKQKDCLDVIYGGDDEEEPAPAPAPAHGHGGPHAHGAPHMPPAPAHAYAPPSRRTGPPSVSSRR